MKSYILKEYGSWSVMSLSFLAGLLASETINFNAVAVFVALSLFINSKQAIALWSRHIDSAKSSAIFIAEVTLALFIMIGTLGEATVKLLPYSLIPIIYVLLLYSVGEHSIVTEIAGFALLTLSAPIAKFAASGVIDHRLYVAVAVFFTASVFKVRLQVKKGALERVLMMLYLAIALLVYQLIKMPVIALFPLLDNLVFSITIYRLRLKAIGWIEVLKGVIFLLLFTENCW